MADLMLVLRVLVGLIVAGLSVFVVCKLVRWLINGSADVTRYGDDRAPTWDRDVDDEFY